MHISFGPFSSRCRGATALVTRMGISVQIGSNHGLVISDVMTRIPERNVLDFRLYGSRLTGGCDPFGVMNRLRGKRKLGEHAALG
ncbi:hypothetical protein CDL15_Pgr023424 [Punica granatum]|nr:hypothetical protein CDL15_Pgr023424 [Punica granatum]